MASSPTEPAENLTPSDQSDAIEANANPPPKLINRELAPEEQEKLNILSSISDLPKKERSTAIDEAAEKLGVTTRTIRRQLYRLQTEGVAVLATGRNDKGQYRIAQAWRDFIIDLYKWGRREGSRRNINQVYGSLEALASRGEQLRDLVKNKVGFAKLLNQEKSKEKKEKYKQVVDDLVEGKHPSCMTVYKVINNHINGKTAQKKRHPGADIDHQVVQTTQGDLKITHSNQVWQIDHTTLDVFVKEKNIEDQNSGGTLEVIKDKSGTPMRPFLTIVMDSFSGCIVGYYLGFEAANSQRVALALRQSILPKANFCYPLQKEWQQYGIPEYIVTDRAKEFKSSHVKQVAEQLDIKWCFRAFPSAGGLVETIFNQGNNEVLKAMPGYTGSNTQERPPNAEKHACMTLDELESELVKYFVDHYNQHTYPKVKHDPQFKVLTRARRWEDWLLDPLEAIAERDLDICLLMKECRTVQKYGCVLFQTLVYEGDCLKDNNEITEISIRYDPRNIVTLLAYTKTVEGKPSQFLGVLKARYFQYEQLSLEELKWICRKLRQQDKEIDNTSILNERYDQLNSVEEKRHQKRKRRKQAQHKREQANNQSKVTEIFPQNAPETETTQSATHQSTAKINKDQTAPSRPRRGRSSGLVANIQNWQDYCEENW